MILINNNMKEITFIITSVIHYAEKKLSYSNTRSIFSPEERALQTIKTIRSIKKYIPKAKIILVELGIKPTLPRSLDQLVDKYIYLGNNFLVRKACDGKYKGLGEAVGLLVAHKYFNQNNGFYFKISGRYYLNNDFVLHKWGNLNQITLLQKRNIMSTRLYGFPSEELESWKKALYFSIPYLLTGKSIEYALFKFLSKKNIHNLDILGVQGDCAPSGELIKE